MAERDVSRGVSNALAVLLELEGDVARRLEEARQSSYRLVEEATATAERARDERPQMLSEAVGTLKHRIETEHRAKLVSIEEDAEHEARGFDAIDNTELGSMADTLVDHLLTLVVEPKERSR